MIITKLQNISITILNSNYKFLFSLFVYSFIYFCFYIDSNIVFCMNTTNTIAESKDQLIENLQDEIKRLRNLHSEALQRPLRNDEIFNRLFDSCVQPHERKSEISSFRRSVDEASYSLPTAEAIPVIEGESDFRSDLAFQEIQKENLRLQAQLTAAAKERETFVFLQEENRKLRLENLRLLHENKATKDRIFRLAEDYDNLHQQSKKTQELQKKIYELKPVLEQIQVDIDNSKKMKATHNSFLPNATISKEDKGVQAFSESAIADAMLKSQPKRLRYLK